MAARPAAPLAWALLLLSWALLRGGCRARFAAEADSEDDEEEAVVFQPTPVFLPGESQGQGACWAAVYGVAQSQR